MLTVVKDVFSNKSQNQLKFPVSPPTIKIYFKVQCYTTKETLSEAQRTQGIESITWVNLSTRIVWNWFQWNFLNWLQIWPPDGATCIGCQFCHRMHHLHIDSKFDHQMAPIALVPYLTTRWHHLHWLQTWPPDGTTWISYKFGHQMSPLVLVPNLTTRWLFTNLTTRWHHLHY